jgi:flagellar basal-body rod protein FlgB
MLDALSKDFAFPQRALGLQAYRTEVLAGNMANAETPNYKAVDFDFATALKSAMSGSGNGDLALNATDPRHFSTTPTGDGLGAKMQYRSAVQPSIDGNTVDMDLERGEYMDNALQYQATLTFMNDRISTLKTAITSGS